jgi:hypothetical protein
MQCLTGLPFVDCTAPPTDSLRDGVYRCCVEGSFSSLAVAKGDAQMDTTPNSADEFAAEIAEVLRNNRSFTNRLTRDCVDCAIPLRVRQFFSPDYETWTFVSAPEEVVVVFNVGDRHDLSNALVRLRRSGTAWQLLLVTRSPLAAAVNRMGWCERSDVDVVRLVPVGVEIPRRYRCEENISSEEDVFLMNVETELLSLDRVIQEAANWWHGQTFRVTRRAMVKERGLFGELDMGDCALLPRENASRAGGTDRYRPWSDWDLRAD